MEEIQFRFGNGVTGGPERIFQPVLRREYPGRIGIRGKCSLRTLRVQLQDEKGKATRVVLHRPEPGRSLPRRYRRQRYPDRRGKVFRYHDLTHYDHRRIQSRFE